MQGKADISPPPRVTILMGVRNGAAHLPAQLESIAAQTYRTWHLVCSDDHSTDESMDILHSFAASHPGKVTLIRGPGTGFAANYLSLFRTYGSVGYVCLADQDDIWLPEKLSRALAVLGHGDRGPTLYCGRRAYWYPERNRYLPSPRMERPCSFRNALIENVASGNTIMLTPAAAQLAQSAAHPAPDVFAHDWWLYLLVTAVGGKVIFDNGPPLVLYRQHAGNVIGAGTGLRAQIRRKTGVMNGAFSRRIDANLRALRDRDPLLTPEARSALNAFDAARRQRLPRRLMGLRDVAPYRQRRKDTLGFWGAASLGKV